MTRIKWDAYHCFGMTILSLVYFVIPSYLFFAGFAFISFPVLWIFNWNEIRFLKPSGGIPNYVTLIRLSCLIFLSPFASKISNPVLAIILLFLIVLDGIDGYLARRFNQRTEFGGLFDMETDALFICIVSCMLFEKGMLGKWILIPAFIKYYYTVIMNITGLSRIPESRNLFGASIAVIMFLVLTASFVLREPFRTLAAFSGTVLICVSFLYSFGKIVVSKLKSPDT